MLFQHAVITTLKIYHQQFQILCETYNFFLFLSMIRSRRYIYSTFEFEIFELFSFININKAELIISSSTNVITHKFNLICVFCNHNRFKSFVNIINLFAHIRNQH